MDEGYTVDLAYLDFVKAFNSVNHRFLLNKLESFRIDGNVLNRKNPVLSDEASCDSGSVIGPLLVLLYI